MGKKVESYQSDDGKLFKTEEAMLLHEAQIALTEGFPTLKINVPFIMENAERISALLEPLASYYRKNHPEPSAQTTLKPGTLVEGRMYPLTGEVKVDRITPPTKGPEDTPCDCAALMAGNGGPHHPTCSSLAPGR